MENPTARDNDQKTPLHCTAFNHTDTDCTVARLLLEKGADPNATFNYRNHRQTLLQRSKRIEQLTGRRLSSTADLTDFWLALRARQVLLRSDAAGQDPAESAAAAR